MKKHVYFFDDNMYKLFKCIFKLLTWRSCKQQKVWICHWALLILVLTLQWRIRISPEAHPVLTAACKHSSLCSKNCFLPVNVAVRNWENREVPLLLGDRWLQTRMLLWSSAFLCSCEKNASLQKALMWKATMDNINYEKRRFKPNK